MKENYFKLAVLLTVYNRKDTTISCLQHIFSQKQIEGFDIVVYLTNDGCTDGTKEAVEKEFPQVVIINGDGTLFWNRGMIAAWNRAAKDDCDFYLWLNDDTIISKDAFITLYNASKEMNHESIIVGPCQHDGVMTYGGEIYKKGKITPQRGKLTIVNAFNGNIVWVPKYVFNIVGTMDPYYRHSWGDVDYGLRAGRNGIKSYQVDHYLGNCARHSDYSTWCNPKYSLVTRLRSLKKPNQLNPREIFHFQRQYDGIIPASFHYVTVILRCIFPTLWIKLGLVKVKI